MTQTPLLLAAIALLGACGDPTSTATTSASRQPAAAAAPADVAAAVRERKDLATLRAATGRFHNFAAARDAGYTFLFMDMCMVDGSAEQLGGMGYHFVNPQLLDGTVDIASPEAILYEPQANGQFRLVAVEYVIPKDAWTGADAPTLFGKTFTLNGFGLWALHVWVWKDNPRGLYADWNPNVSCAAATDANAPKHP